MVNYPKYEPQNSRKRSEKKGKSARNEQFLVFTQWFFVSINLPPLYYI